MNGPLAQSNARIDAQLALDLTPERGKSEAPELRAIAAHPERFEAGFAAWLIDNWHVWREFERQASRMAARRKHYSARTIVEVLRHHSALAENGGPWKINDHNTPDLARLFVLMHPEHGTFFEFRVLPTSRRAA